MKRMLAFPLAIVFLPRDELSNFRDGPKGALHVKGERLKEYLGKSQM